MFYNEYNKYQNLILQKRTLQNLTFISANILMEDYHSKWKLATIKINQNPSEFNLQR